MDIDSTIEDLEAQAYFASQQDRTTNEFSLLVEVELHKNTERTKSLSMALIGLDFVAGFQNSQQGQASSWLLIPNHAINKVIVIQGAPELAMVELSAAMFIDTKLRQAIVSLKQLDAVQPFQGRLNQVFGNHLVLDSKGMKLVPLECVQWLAVDSLSTEA